MVSFIASLLITGVMVAIVLRVAKRREPGTPLTWGEAFLAGTFLLALMLMLYGVVPDRWLRWADGDLAWRSDKIGIPTGPLPFKHHLLFAHGVYFFGKGRIIISAQILRDLIETVIYGVAVGGQMFMWSWWQKRGQRRGAVPELETSAYGRPLMRET
jgi:hypothetical protein